MRKKTQRLLIGFLALLVLGSVITVVAIPGLRETIFGAAKKNPKLNISHVACVDPTTGRVEVHFVLVHADNIDCPGSTSYTMTSPCSGGGSAGNTKKTGGTCHYSDFPTCGDGTYTITGGNAGPYNLSNPGSSYNISGCQPPPPTDTPIPPTNTPVPPTDTPIPPTDTPVPPTDTPVPPTDTPVPPTPTDTPVPPTDTPIPPTDTPVPPTNTPGGPTDTPAPTPTGTVVVEEVTPTPTPTPPPPTPTGPPPPTATPSRFVEVTPTPGPTLAPGCPVCPQPAILACPACPPVPVFHTDEAGNWDLARLPLEGEEGVINLTDNAGRDLGPSFSADGWWIAFQSNRDGNWEIYTMDFFGRLQTRQTYNPHSDTDPVWSPACLERGRSCITGTLAFQSDRSGNWDIFLLDTGTTDDPFQVTTDSGDDTDPFWAPDASTLTFQSNRNGNWDIFTINTNGSDETQLTESEGDEIDPVWSPDGTSIAYASNRDEVWDLYILDLENGSETQLTSDAGDNLLPAWSPGSNWIAFQSDRDGNLDIYAYNVISDVLVQLTDNPADDEAPTWNCDGSQVIFHSDRDGDNELYAVSLADPANVVQLTSQDSAEQNVAWNPVSEDGSLALEAVEEEAEPEETEEAALEPTEEAAEPTPTTPAAKPNWLLLGGIGVLLALVFLAVGWAVGSRRKI